MRLLIGRLLREPSIDLEEEAVAALRILFVDLDSLMARLEQDGEGAPMLGDFAHAVAAELRRARGKCKLLLGRLQAMENAAAAQVATASKAAQETMTGIGRALEDSTTERYLKLGESNGAKAAARFVYESANLLQRYISQLESQREAIKEDMSAQGAAREQSLSRLKELVPKGWLRGGKHLRREIQEYAQATSRILHAQFALESTAIVLRTLSECRQTYDALSADVDNLLRNLTAVSRRCREAEAAYEEDERKTTYVERPLGSSADLQALYEEIVNCEWETLSPEATTALELKTVGFAQSLRLGADAVYFALMEAALTVVGRVCEMTADDYVRWVLHRSGDTPALFVRDALRRASPLCRLERARLPAEDDLSDSTFRLVGVLDARRSVFAGVPDILAIDTGDRERIVFVTVKTGFPPSSLWRAPRYRDAYTRVKQEGRIALDIYPDFPPFNPDGKTDRGRGRTRQRTRKRS